MPLNDFDEYSVGVMEETNTPYLTEIGNVDFGDDTEIGAEIQQVVKQARDNRMPPPKMKAVDIDAPPSLDDDWGLMDVCIGAAEVTGDPNPFPVTAALMQRFGAGGEPRFVRVDTAESYKEFRASNSPEMQELRTKVMDVKERFDEHARDPYAHEALRGEIEELTLLGAEVKQVEEQKRIELWMPQRFDGLLEAWREGEYVCASIVLPSIDGKVRICTALEPMRKCIAEMARHASEADVPASAVVGVLPAMGCVLGAGTVIKEMAAAAPSILQRPEARQAEPFVVRIEPKANPALCALAALAVECLRGNQKACEEWKALCAVGPAPVKQAMSEALALLKDAGVA